MDFTRIRQFVIRYERHLSVAATILGFVIDNALLKRPDDIAAILLLYSYLILSGIFIFAIHFAEEGVWTGEWKTALRPWLPIGLQFIFGSLFSAFIVFYSRGASLSASWPFLLLLLIVFAGTEVFKKYQDRLVYQCTLYFFGLFSFCVYYVPLSVGSIGTNVFLISGAVAAVAFALFTGVLFLTGRKRFSANLKRIVVTAVSVYALMNLLYFTHVLPPLPLALKDIGVYHLLVRTETGYEVSGERVNFLETIFGSETLHIKKGESAYVFSSVFTPVAIRTNLVHRWEHQDNGKWVTTSVVSFPVIGGRDGGYRGFSQIDGIPEGEWRVSVETMGGQPIGRTAFSVQYVAGEPALQKSTH